MKRLTLPEQLERVRARAVKKALMANDGAVNATARELGIARATLYYIIERNGLRPICRRHYRGGLVGGNAAWQALADA